MDRQILKIKLQEFDSVIDRLLEESSTEEFGENMIRHRQRFGSDYYYKTVEDLLDKYHMLHSELRENFVNDDNRIYTNSIVGDDLFLLYTATYNEKDTI